MGEQTDSTPAGGFITAFRSRARSADFAKHEANVVLCAAYFHDSLVIVCDSSRIRHLGSPIALTEHKISVEVDTISDHILSSAYGGALRTSAVHQAFLAEGVTDLGGARSIE